MGGVERLRLDLPWARLTHARLPPRILNGARHLCLSSPHARRCLLALALQGDGGSNIGGERKHDALPVAAARDAGATGRGEQRSFKDETPLSTALKGVDCAAINNGGSRFAKGGIGAISLLGTHSHFFAVFLDKLRPKCPRIEGWLRFLSKGAP